MLKIKLFSVILSLAFIGFGAFLSTAVANQGGGTGDDAGVTLPNPLGETNDIWQLIDNIIRALRAYIAPPIVTLMVLYGAFQILFAGGEPEKFANGKKTILWAVIGYAIILIASGISLVIRDVLS